MWKIGTDVVHRRAPVRLIASIPIILLLAGCPADRRGDPRTSENQTESVHQPAALGRAKQAPIKDGISGSNTDKAKDAGDNVKASIRHATEIQTVNAPPKSWNDATKVLSSEEAASFQRLGLPSDFYNDRFAKSFKLALGKPEREQKQFFADLAIARGMDLQIDGITTDEKDTPLSDVTVSISKVGISDFYTASNTTAGRAKIVTKAVSGEFGLKIYGGLGWTITFSKPGYVTREYKTQRLLSLAAATAQKQVLKQNSDLDKGARSTMDVRRDTDILGAFRAGKSIEWTVKRIQGLKVVLRKRAGLPTKVIRFGTLASRPDNSGTVLNLLPRDGQRPETYVSALDKWELVPDAAIVLTIERGAVGQSGSDATGDHRGIRLKLKRRGDGFIRFSPPENPDEVSFLTQMHTAPPDGYESTFEVNEQDWAAPFFIRVNNTYGKGHLRYRPIVKEDGSAEVSIEVFLNPTGDREVETYE